MVRYRELEGEELEADLQPKLPVMSLEEVMMLYKEIQDRQPVKTFTNAEKTVDWEIMAGQSV